MTPDVCSSDTSYASAAAAAEAAEWEKEKAIVIRHLMLLVEAVKGSKQPGTEQQAAAAAAPTHQPAMAAPAPATTGGSSSSSQFITEFPTPELLYKIKPMDMELNRRSGRKLYTIDYDPNVPIEQAAFSCELPDGTRIRPRKAVDDSGCTPPLWTEAACERFGMPFTRCATPQVVTIDNSRCTIVGRTVPHAMILGAGTKRPLRKWLAEGALVVAGAAGELFDCCIGTDALKEYFAYSNPLHQHLVWNPDGPQGNVSQLNGVPISIHAYASVAAALDLQTAAALVAMACLETGAGAGLEAGVGAAVTSSEQAAASAADSVQSSDQQTADAVTDMDPLLTPAAAQSAAARHSSRRQRTGISSRKLVQQVGFFLVLLWQALTAAPVFSMQAPTPFGDNPALLAWHQHDLATRPDNWIQLQMLELEGRAAMRPRSRFRLHGAVCCRPEQH